MKVEIKILMDNGIIVESLLFDACDEGTWKLDPPIISEDGLCWLKGFGYIPILSFLSKGKSKGELAK